MKKAMPFAAAIGIVQAIPALPSADDPARAPDRVSIHSHTAARFSYFFPLPTD
ncbi:hypothetical protein [Burkholderia anthina]|uniref:hypothetical protein n=1 Tax=Burkholderia anthina TaxID=179879 RepID=UPI00158E6DE9|nr:hypothetical protein [Burkholderia anthina]